VSSAKNSPGTPRKVDKALLEKLAHLARLEFDEKKAEEMLNDLNKMVDWVDKLKEVDVEGVEPLTTMAHEPCPLAEDIPQPPLDRETALKNAPRREGNFFSVPKVIE
jgi:aspartyl-tRNA(Asn)/glutamyl-tRNA(Gln) amidotransferase subunit C